MDVSIKRRTRPLSVEMAGQIKALLDAGLFQHQIAAIYGINQGRISEVKTGKRFPGVPPTQGSLDFD